MGLISPIRRAAAFLLIGVGISCSGWAEGLGDVRLPLTLMWQVPHTVSDDELEYLAVHGIKVVHHFQLTSWNDEDIQKYLDRLNQHHLKGLIYLGHVLGRARAGEAPWRLGEKAVGFIRKWKGHPAVFGWHTFDEPKEISKMAQAKNQAAIFRQIKQIDSEHPVVVSTNLLDDSEFEAFFSEEAFDILEVHAYPNTATLTRPRALLKHLEKHKTKNYPVWMTIRAFNGKQWSDLDSDSINRQYKLACESILVSGIGLYGWMLDPNHGISSVPDIRKQFESMPKDCKGLDSNK